MYTVGKETLLGGNALKTLGLSAARLPASEFYPLRDAFVCQYEQAFPGVRIVPIPAYGQKADFGDLDVLVEQEAFEAAGGPEALVAWASSVGHCRGHVHQANSSAVSLEWRQGPSDKEGFQVDVITSPAAEMDFCLRYFSYNDLGNLMGRIAEGMGFVYGHRGLLYRMREGTHQFDCLTVSMDNDKVMAFMGYDPLRFKEGFQTLEEIFVFAASSPYFNPDMYLLENRNHTSRMRDRKRTTYKQFLLWIEDRPGLPAHPLRLDNQAWLQRAREAFSGFGAAIEQSLENLQRQRFIRSLFNGKTVGEMTGLSGESLGLAMERVREAMPDGELEALLRQAGLAGLGPMLLPPSVDRVKPPRP